MNKPIVSVIIPSYNRFEYLLNALKSVYDQTFKNYEIIILNDDSDQVEYKNFDFPKKVKIIHIDRNNTPDWGGSRQPLRNIGSQNASGEYLAFLDDDDFWLPQKLEIQINEMKNRNFLFSSTEGLFGSGTYSINNNYQLYNSERFLKTLKKKYRGTSYLKKGKFPEIWSYDFLSIHNCTILSSVIVQKNLYDKIGGMRGLPKAADYDCWLSILKITNMLYIDKPLCYYDSKHGDGKLYS